MIGTERNPVSLRHGYPATEVGPTIPVPPQPAAIDRPLSIPNPSKHQASHQPLPKPQHHQPHRPSIINLTSHPKPSTLKMSPPPAPNNSTPYILPLTSTTTPNLNAAPLANYPHARLLAPSPSTTPTTTRTIYISGTSSRRGDGTYAGCTPLPTTPPTYSLDCAAQTAAVLSNIDKILRGATSGRHGVECVVDATVFLTDLAGDYAGMNAAWNAVWPEAGAAPARTCVEVAALPGGGRLCVEIKCVAVVPVEVTAEG